MIVNEYSGYVRTRSNLLHATEKVITTARGDVDGAASQENVAKYEVLAKVPCPSLLRTSSTPPFRAELISSSRRWAWPSTTTPWPALRGSTSPTVLDPSPTPRKRTKVNVGPCARARADYAERLSIGSDRAQEVVSEVVGKLLARQSAKTLPKFDYCPYLNISVCPATARLSSGPVPVVAYNPLAWTATYNFRIPVPFPDVSGMHSLRCIPQTFLSDRPLCVWRSDSGGEHQGGDRDPDRAQRRRGGPAVHPHVHARPASHGLPLLRPPARLLLRR
jgi:hypothetical protein